MNELYIPKKIIVGSTLVSSDTKIVSCEDEITGKLFNSKIWNSGIVNKSIPPQVFDNTPMNEFRLCQITDINNYIPCSRDYCFVHDPRGFNVEIDYRNLEWIMNYYSVLDKEIIGDLVYSVSDHWRVTLVPVSSEQYSYSIMARDNVVKSKKFSDLIPGSLYNVKGNSLRSTINYATLLSNEFYYNYNLVYVGEVTVMKDFGRKYEKKGLFFDPGKKNEEFAVLLDMKDVKFKLRDNVLNSNEIQDIIFRFNKSAYSLDFWNGKVKISELVTSKTLFNRLIKPSIRLLNNNDKEFNLYKSYYFYEDVKYGIYVRNAYYYKSYKFSIKNKVLEFTKIVDIGRINEHLRNKMGYSTLINFDYNFNYLYPNSKSLDIDIIKNQDKSDNFKEEMELPLNYSDYITEDNYYSESLSEIFSINCGITGKSILIENNFFKLPKKIK